MTQLTLKLMKDINFIADGYTFNNNDCTVFVGKEQITISSSTNEESYSYESLETDGYTIWSRDGTLRPYKIIREFLAPKDDSGFIPVGEE